MQDETNLTAEQGTVQTDTTEGTQVESQVSTAPEQTTSTKDTVKYFKSFVTEDEWNTYKESIVNKTNTDMLKEFNVNSVKELKDMLKQYETTNAEMTEQLKQIQVDNALVNVADEYKEDALDIAQAQCNRNKDLSLQDAIANVLSKNPSWAIGQKPAKLGLDKTQSNTEGSKSKLAEIFYKNNPDAKKYLE